MAKRRLTGSKMKMILAHNNFRCAYQFGGCKRDQGLMLVWVTPPSLGGDPADVTNYRCACRVCNRRLPPLIRTQMLAAA